MFTSTLLVSLLSIAPAFAAPAPGWTPSRLSAGKANARGLSSIISGVLGDGSKDKPTALAANPVDEFLRPALFAQAAYCSSEAIEKWSCGPPCDSLGKDIEVLIAGGNDGTIPGYFVAIDPTEDAVVVSHQGTDAKNIMSILNDAEFLLGNINTTLFPGVDDKVQVHGGFAWTQGRTADAVLSTVQGALKDKKASKVRVHGHSLGAAIAMMDALMFNLNLDPSVEVKTVMFGLPRGGNQEFADLLDQKLGKSFQFITNQHDPVPEVPPRFVGYAHASNEVHIASIDATTAVPTSVLDCPGQDNVNCATGNNLLKASVGDHKGPYFRPDILMAHSGCPL